MAVGRGLAVRILFSHQNYPAQFGAFGAWLATRGWDVTFATAKEGAEPPRGCRMIRMAPHRSVTEGVHRFASGHEQAMINAQGFANAAIRAREMGFVPDIVVAHSGWGSGTFAKAVWPETRFVAYAEWWYRYPPVDDLGTPPRSTLEDARAHALARNAPLLLDLAIADAAFCPTEFQAAQFPDHVRARLTVMHDGVDTATDAPGEAVALDGAGEPLPADAEVVTYATRGMEPHRGFPEFMRALALLQARRPRLHAVIGGEDRVAYGARLPEGESWKARMLAECAIDPARTHFRGPLPRGAYRRLLQSSDVHVYLTVPFVLSWSMIEAMSIACPLVASDVEPVREAVRDGVEARLVDHADIEALAGAIEALLDDRDAARRLGAAARRTAIARYARDWLWPARADLLDRVARGETG
ncbi:MAG: glycosyltransferase [Pseudomonadota bacterium]